MFQLNSDWTDAFSTELRVSHRDYKRDQTPFGGREFAQFEVCLDTTFGGLGDKLLLAAASSSVRTLAVMPTISTRRTRRST